MAISAQRICIDVKTFVFDSTKIVSFRCFSDGVIEKFDYLVPEWVEIGNGKNAKVVTGDCGGFSIHFLNDKNFLAVRWFKDGTVQQAHPGGVWISVQKKK